MEQPQLVPFDQIVTLINTTPEDHDSDNVDFIHKETKKRLGFGYRGKKDKKIHVLRCPACDTENYAPQVAVGPCYRCGFYPIK